MRRRAIASDSSKAPVPRTRMSDCTNSEATSPRVSAFGRIFRLGKASFHPANGSETLSRSAALRKKLRKQAIRRRTVVTASFRSDTIAFRYAFKVSVPTSAGFEAASQAAKSDKSDA